MNEDLRFSVDPKLFNRSLLHSPPPLKKYFIQKYYTHNILKLIFETGVITYLFY